MTHSDCISLEDCALAETTMITRELSGYYADDDLSYIYTKWESSKDNNGIQGSRNAAKIFFNDFERAVDTRQVDERADIAEEIHRGIYPNE